MLLNNPPHLIDSICKVQLSLAGSTSGVPAQSRLTPNSLEKFCPVHSQSAS